jgi:anti-sigma regulatory factor (Ser/Thr protein kinase)
VLALDEMASNALRHGGGEVRAALRLTEDAYLIEVSDQAAAAPPTPAVDRDPSEGGLGLYLIAEMATQHGWYVEAGHKYVWALLPRG